jgi:phage gp45-like
MRDRTQGDRPLLARIDRVVQRAMDAVYGLVEWESIASISNGDGGAPQAQTSDGDDVQVLETYGLASRPSGTATALVLAPGTETTARVALGVSSPAGRPATDQGDTVLYTTGGHEISLRDDGDLTITGKDGATIVLADTGDITVNAPVNGSVTVNVSGTGAVNVGGPAALPLLQASAAQVHIAAAATFGALNFLPNDGGVKALTSFAAYILGIPPAVPGQDLVQAAATTKAKGE